MALHAGGRIDSAVYLVLAQVITAMWQVALDSIAKFGTRFKLFFVGVAVGTERFRMTGITGVLCPGIVLVLQHKIGCLVVKRTPVIGMAFRAVGESFYLFRMHPGNAVCIRTGIQKACQ